jgi:hypothetical protein
MRIVLRIPIGQALSATRNSGTRPDLCREPLRNDKISKRFNQRRKLWRALRVLTNAEKKAHQKPGALVVIQRLTSLNN